MREDKPMLVYYWLFFKAANNIPMLYQGRKFKYTNIGISLDDGWEI